VALSSEPSATAPTAQAPTQVSSLQQLLALKSRVLMELQKHGIGGKPTQPVQAGAVTTAGGQASAAAGTTPASGVAANGSTANSHVTSGNFDLSPANLSFAAAIGAALVALLAGFGLRRRKGRATRGDAAATARATEGTGSSQAAFSQDDMAPRGEVDTRGQVVVTGEPAQDVAAVDAAATEAAARATAEREAAEHEVVAREVAAHGLAVGNAPSYEMAEREAEAREAAAQEAAAHQAVADESAAREAAERGTIGERKAGAGSGAVPEDEVVAEHEADAEREASAEHEAIAEREAAAEREAVTEHEATPNKAVADDPAVPPAFGATEHASSEAPLTASSEDGHVPALNSLEEVAGSAATPTAADQQHADVPAPIHVDAASEQGSHPSPPDAGQSNQVSAHSPEEPTASAPGASQNPPVPQIDFGAPALFGGLQTVATSDETFGDAEPSFNPTAYQQPEAPKEPDVLDLAAHAEGHVEGHAETQAAPTPAEDTAFPPNAPSADASAEPPAPSGFPRSAVDAFSGLDFGLPPRIEPIAPLGGPDSLSTPPVVEPEITAQQAVPRAPVMPRHAAEEINAGIAGSAAVAGLGAAHFGALNLDFDLELPPSPAQPLPSFTPQDLVRIARNKLELASEYIELGDLAGARALIHEVIDANDTATRTEARALLSTLAPLS
jgi:FimV-like protein